MASEAKFGGGAAGAPKPHGHLVLPPGRTREALAFAAGAVASALLLLCPASILSPTPIPNIVSSIPSSSPSTTTPSPHSSTTSTPSAAAAISKSPRTFYDDPSLTYTIHTKISNWDTKRSTYLHSHHLDPSSPAILNRVVMVSGSQPEPCKSSTGDHYLLRFLKNKLDYVRLHTNIKFLYNTAHLEPSMVAYWAKIPLVRAAMLAHPDAEWVWWVDADAVFTDMDFALPLDKYAGYNLVIYGWDSEVYEEKSWVGLNAGVFLIRNCQWGLDLLDAWAKMGPAFPEYKRWGKTMKEELEGKPNEESDDQSALVYLLSKHPDKWGGNRTLLETEYYFQGYWAEIVGRLDGVADRYAAVESARRNRALRRRHAEREHVMYAAARDDAVGKRKGGVPGPKGGGQKGWRRPFVTHFTGCQPCGGAPDRKYTRRRCEEGMRRALAFADDQVLRAYGFRHAAPLSDSVVPLPFDYPAAL
ncbi:unnamed protein product [Urochloa humidicola]